ncbi:MAG: membrane protein insertion efficiency factor YidD [Planctomycetes bacterium]|nr:membrane protein insertion efficiency factor YidD [Planctomycetota bacterium]
MLFIVRYLLILLIRTYRAIWYPIYRGMKDAGIPTPECACVPTCSEYAILAIRKLPAHRAIIQISYRLKRCGQYHKEGQKRVVDYP